MSLTQKTGPPRWCTSTTTSSSMRPKRSCHGCSRPSDSIGLPTSKARIRSWRAENPKGKRGTHQYTLDEYGLDRSTVADAFADYTQRFAVRSEFDGVGR